MAKPVASASETTAYAVVENSYLLPLDEAIELMKLLARAQKVESTWRGETPFKFRKDGGDMTLKMLTPAQYAMMELERDNPQ